MVTHHSNGAISNDEHTSPFGSAMFFSSLAIYSVLLLCNSWDNNMLRHLIEGSTTFLRQSSLCNVILFISTTSVLTAHQSHFSKCCIRQKEHKLYPIASSWRCTSTDACNKRYSGKKGQQKNLVFIVMTKQKKIQTQKLFIDVIFVCRNFENVIFDFNYLYIKKLYSWILKCIKIIAFLCSLLFLFFR